MRQRSYLASVASPIGAGEAPAFPLYRPAPEEARASVAEPRAVHSAAAASPPQTVRRKPAKARPAGAPFSIARAAEPPPAPGPTAPRPSPTATEAPTPDALAPLATPVELPAPSLQPFEPAARPLAVNRPEIAPFAASPFTPTPSPKAPAPVVFPAGEAPLLPSPGPGAPPAAASPHLAAPAPNSESRAEIFGDEMVALAPRPRDPRAPLEMSDPFSPPPPASSASASLLNIPRVEIGILEVRGAPAPRPPAPVAVAAPRPSGPVARGYGWSYGLYQG
jgi:hypothetical protein